MTNDEVDVLVAHAQRAHGAAPLTGARLFWCVAGIAAVSAHFGGIWFALFMVVVSGGIGFIARVAGKEANARWRHDFARRAWHFIAHDARAFHSDSTSTNSLKRRIGQIYESDPRGNGFPLSQAVRLLDAHLRQQKRLARIEAHIHSLSQQREQLLLKLARLHELGEDNPTGRIRLERLSKDIFALEISAVGIQASCSRLEAIVVKIHQAEEVKKLHREINQLSNGDSLAPELQSEEANDIERQIGREIETFLRLERETDEHLRDV